MDAGLLPPFRVRIALERFDPAAEVAWLHELDGAGAVVSFTGLCRSEAGRLQGLELEHFPGMAEEEIGRVVTEACGRWPLLGVHAVHRAGQVLAGEEIVVVGTASAHRRAAFEAAEFVMDWLKTSAPFWKREILEHGAPGEWIAAKDIDDEAAERWR
ncbi:molybdenum cofactor biosynthesis protein MoaE [Lutibaculum baratangense]|uniref:Molybdopterin synthase catalytic subunit n=1 Tax=Lutibaculum baratangense AMV1 TaxID=631454 RepID=V4T9K7_9HYPH|nr:molybdenum cofactor biosynthesis protein MoaE [Lutibaculum baratangense]ESR23203.1 Molybdenum cofactor biosynthesis protein MoaE [Lutibaculum baratangense AMV1]